jgi:thymidylate synthase
MKKYIEALKDTLIRGKIKPNRTGVKCLTSTPKFFEHDMSSGFPLLTQKHVSFKTIAVELEAFIFGITDKKWLKDRNCNIWNEWSNPNSDDTDDLGPIYGFQWRRFNQVYHKNSEKLPPHFDQPYDQLANVIKTLKEDPNNRRLVVSAWNPIHMCDMALPPCHYSFVLQHIEGRLSLNWTQRSCDAFLGVPYNIASYGLLLELIAKETNLKPHILSGNLIDFHIYENHIEQCKIMIENSELDPPELRLDEGSFWDWDHSKAICSRYVNHGKILADVAI